MAKNISPAGSMKGYKFSVWFDRNKNNIKNLLMGVSALVTYFSTLNNPQWLNILLTAIIPVLLRLIIDALDFYSSDVRLE